MQPVELHYRDEGAHEKPALVLSSSLGSTLESWNAVLPELADAFRVIRYDHRGHGRSPAPAGPYTIADLGGDVLTLLDRLKLERVSFCGISLGGMVGMWLAAHAPERIEGLALVCTSARLAPHTAWYERAAFVRARGTKSVADAVVARWLTPTFSAQHPKLADALRAQIAATSAEGYASCCEAIATWDGLDLLHRITAKTLVIAGRRDVAIPAVHAQVLCAGLPHARLAWLDAAHVPVFERPKELARDLRARLSGNDGRLFEQLDADEQLREGERIRREVLGDAHVDRARESTSRFTADFQDFITRSPWGAVWSRPGLTRAERSIVTLSVLAARSHHEELAMHVKAALRNGLSVTQLREILIHISAYAGVPEGNRAFHVAQQALSELGIEEALTPARSEGRHA